MAAAAAVKAEYPARRSRRVLVTGGSSGIGAALVAAFHEAGDEVWFTYRSGAQRAEELKAKLLSSGNNAPLQAFELDQSSKESITRLVGALPATPEIVIHNAGLGSGTVRHVAADSYSQDEALLLTNALGPLLLQKKLLQSMRAMVSENADMFCKIVFISSVGGGITHFPGFRIADGMSKAAIAYLGRHLQASLSQENVDVFTVCPGAVETPMFQDSTLNSMTKEEVKAFSSSLPGGRMIAPQEIAQLVLNLCSPTGRVLRGAVIDASLGLGTHPGLITGNAAHCPDLV